MIIPELMYFVVLTHSAVNVHVNTGATNFICLSEDLIEIMNTGNNMYSTLSHSSEQVLLVLTDLPGMVRIFETQYELQYSESCVGNLFGNCFPIEGFAYCAIFELHRSG